jgi:Cof subfamily protein (haloacid dehalogenase superfamily)
MSSPGQVGAGAGGRDAARGARKAVFVDVDGTLLGDDGRVPPSAAGAVRRARAAGHLVLLCTGRSLAELWPPILSVGFDGVVAASGSYVEVGGVPLCHRTIPGEQLRRAAAYFESHHTPVYFQGNDDIYAAPAAQDYLRALVVDSLTARDGRATSDDTLLGFVESIRTDTDPLREPIMKVVYFGAPVSLEQLIAEFGADFEVVRAAFPLFGSHSGELSLRGVHKAYGMDIALAHLGVSLADTIAIGDSYNDLEMLEHAAVSVAMAHAPDQVKAAADFVTGTPAQDGIEAAFRRLGLSL